jgi:cytochrome c oxidase assembly protein subunit 11
MVVLLSAVVAGMVGLTFAAVPLYRLFCQVTGYGGTTQVAQVLPEEVGERIVKVRFNADVDAHLPWTFAPAQVEVALRVGEVGMAFYRARNLTGKAITGAAVFNVTPLKAGQYFNKVQCFCFDEQRLEPGQSVDMPVTFFVDPAIDDDPNLDDVRTITLSYTFFRTEDGEAEGESSVSGRTGRPSAPDVAQSASLQ